MAEEKTRLARLKIKFHDKSVKINTETTTSFNFFPKVLSLSFGAICASGPRETVDNSTCSRASNKQNAFAKNVQHKNLNYSLQELLDEIFGIFFM